LTGVLQGERKSTWLGIDTGGAAWGFACGCMLIVGASGSFAMARAGIVAGLDPIDIIFMRFVVAGLFFLPVLLRLGLWSLAGIGWRRGLVLLVTGGPLFSGLQTGGYSFAPLAHGGVMGPAAVTLLSTLIAATVLRERLSRAHVVGGGMVVGGIVLISWHGLVAGGGSLTWVGDAMFLASSALWAVFTVLLRYWRLDAVRAVAVTSVLSLVAMVPGYAATAGFGHLLAQLAGPLLVQGLVQGGLQGVLGILGYSQAIRVLGVSKAVLFPAVVPAMSILVGIPVAGEWPTLVQVAGMAVVTAGLLTAIGAFRRRAVA
jgi:hypothetical protein